jgi:hypothetical protein
MLNALLSNRSTRNSWRCSLHTLYDFTGKVKRLQFVTFTDPHWDVLCILLAVDFGSIDAKAFYGEFIPELDVPITNN